MVDFYEDYLSKVLEEKRRKDIEEFKRQARENKNPKKDCSKIQDQRKQLKKWKFEKEDNRRSFSMNVNYKIQNKKLKRLVENKAKKLNTSVGELVWAYVNRGLMNDGLNDDKLEERHSNGF